MYKKPICQSSKRKKNTIVIINIETKNMEYLCHIDLANCQSLVTKHRSPFVLFLSLKHNSEEIPTTFKEMRILWAEKKFCLALVFNKGNESNQTEGTRSIETPQSTKRRVLLRIHVSNRDRASDKKSPEKRNASSPSHLPSCPKILYKK